jgi:hypothetical protein
MTYLLSPNTFAGPLIGMPNILSLYLNASIISTQMHVAANSDLNVDVSTVLCALENQIMGAQLRYIKILVRDRLVTRWPA